MSANDSGRNPKTGLPAIARFGSRDLNCRLVAERAPDPAGRYVELHFDVEELHRDPPDLIAPVQVFHDPSLGVPHPEKARAGGYVTRLEEVDDTTWRLEAHDMANWADAKGGGLSIKNFQAPEVLYAMGRDLGFGPDQIRIAGWQPPLERFVVAMPVEGVEPKGELDAGSPALGLTADPEVPKRWSEHKHKELKPLFTETGYWAVCSVVTRTMWDAEQIAARRIDRLLGRLILAARYSFSETPDKALREFRRERQLEQVQLREVSGVQGLRSGRSWIRGFSRSRAPSPSRPVRSPASSSSSAGRTSPSTRQSPPGEGRCPSATRRLARLR